MNKQPCIDALRLRKISDLDIRALKYVKDLREKLQQVEDNRGRSSTTSAAGSTMGSAAPSRTASRTPSLSGSTTTSTTPAGQGEDTPRPNSTSDTRTRGRATFQTALGLLTLEQMREAFDMIPGVNKKHSSSKAINSATINALCDFLKINRTSKTEQQKIAAINAAAQERESSRANSS